MSSLVFDRGTTYIQVSEVWNNDMRQMMIFFVLFFWWGWKCL